MSGTPPQAPLAIGALGAARITPPALVAPARVIGARLVVVGARDRARAEAFAQAHGFKRGVAGYDAVIGADVDLVYNALPASRHAAWTIKALEAGRHVLCEKPLAMSLAEAEAMRAAAKRSGARLIEAFHHRYHPSWATLLRWVSEGRIGRVRRVEAVFDVGIDPGDGAEIRYLPETGGGAFMDLGCYPLCWARDVVGEAPEAAEAEAVVTASGVDAAMIARLAFPGGAEARLSCDMRVGTPFRAALRVEGEDGEVAFENPLAPHQGARLTLTSGRGGTEEAKIDPATTYEHQLRAVAAALRGGEPLPTEGDALTELQAALDVVYEAAGLGHLRRTFGG